MKYSKKCMIFGIVTVLATAFLFKGFISCKEEDREFNVHEYDKKFRAKFIQAFPVLAQEILDYAKKTKGVCIDIGCGPGYLGLAIAKKSQMTIHSLDISAPAIEIVKKYVKERCLSGRVIPVVGDVHRMPYSDNFADLVVSRGSLPFWTDKTTAFKEINRVLKPGGIAYIGCGFGTGYRTIIEDRKHKSKKPPKKFTHDEILEALTGADIVDFTVIDDYNRGYWVIIRK